MKHTHSDNPDILERAREQGLATPSAGMRVPDGYFADFNRRMAEALPHRPEAEDPDYQPVDLRPNWWSRVRPFAYMAAMFAGIWLMLQMFAMMGGQGTQLEPTDKYPVLAEAFADDDFMYDYVYADYNSYDLLDDMDYDDSNN